MKLSIMEQAPQQQVTPVESKTSEPFSIDQAVERAINPEITRAERRSIILDAVRATREAQTPEQRAEQIGPQNAIEVLNLIDSSRPDERELSNDDLHARGALFHVGNGGRMPTVAVPSLQLVLLNTETTYIGLALRNLEDRRFDMLVPDKQHHQQQLDRKDATKVCIGNIARIMNLVDNLGTSNPTEAAAV